METCSFSFLSLLSFSLDLLAISNDDDFGIIDNGAGSYAPKYLPFYSPQKIVDRGVTYLINLSANQN